MSVASPKSGAPIDQDAAAVETDSRVSAGRGLWQSKAVRYSIGALLLVILTGVALWWFKPPEMHGVVLQSPQRATDFTLTASTGEPLSLSDLRGKYVLIYFGYTFCPDVCPTTLNDLVDTMDALGKKAKDVQVVMVSVDPQRDTPEQLASYLKYFDPSFLGMTGSVGDVDAAGTQFGVYFEAREGSAATGYLVDHTSTITLIDPDGYMREVFPYGTAGDEIAADVAYWMR